ncbi:MAG: PD40 domain-containing protein [Anaerolineales bacterium]|nr:PD40 domain-containing protein [Anaerolineales bacterium]
MPPIPRVAPRLALWALRTALALPLVLAATACLPEGIKVPQSELSALLEVKSGLIAYLGVDGNIYTIDQGGGRQTPITTDARQDDSGYFFYGLPTWSPDSQRLAFAAYRGVADTAPDHTSLFTARSDGTELTEALTTEDFLLFWAWAPDSQRVGYVAETPNNSLAFALVPRQGGESQLLDVGAPYYWSWAPSGHSLLVHAGARLALLELDPSVTEQVLDIAPGEFNSPAFSPAGDRALLAAENADGGADLLVTDALGGNARTLTSYTGNIAFAWSPNGERVAYLLSDSALAGAPGQLVVADPNGQGKPVELPADVPVYAFFWSPDSKSLAYFTEPPADPGTPEATAEAASGDQAIRMSLDVMNAGNGRTHNVATYVPTTQFLQVIPYFEQYHQSLTIWSPDSKNLVVSAYGGGGTPGIFVVAASGRLEPRYVADGWMGFWSWK